MKNFFILIVMICSLTSLIEAQTITTIAGTGEPGYSGDEDAARGAQLNFPYGLSIDAAGNLFIGENFNYTVRRVGTNGMILTTAGTGTPGYSNDDSAAVTAQLNFASAIAVDAAGNTYIADWGNNRIRKINTSGIITTIAGTGVAGYSGDGGDAKLAQISTPSGIAVDAQGNIFFTEYNNNVLRKIDINGHISTVAGTGVSGFSGDQGPSNAAQLSLPHGVAVDNNSGSIYIVDVGNNRIRKIIGAAGIITTFAGTGNASFSGDGGAATLAEINMPQGVAVDAAGNVYFTDHLNNRIRKINTSGIINTLAGIGGSYVPGSPRSDGDGGPAIKAAIIGPIGIAISSTGVVYFAEAFNHKIRMIK